MVYSDTFSRFLISFSFLQPCKTQHNRKYKIIIHSTLFLYQQCLYFRYSTPLHDAVCCGRQEVVRLLLEAGAEVDALDYKEATPLKLAIRCEV